MGRSDEEVFDKIFRARAHADPALAAARLPPIGVDCRPLQIPAVRDGHGHIFHRHQVFETDVAGSSMICVRRSSP